MEKLSRHEMELLLASVAYYMGPELRCKVMQELPLAYNKWMGHEVMTVALKTEPADAKA